MADDADVARSLSCWRRRKLTPALKYLMPRWLSSSHRTADDAGGAVHAVSSKALCRRVIRSAWNVASRRWWRWRIIASKSWLFQNGRDKAPAVFARHRQEAAIYRKFHRSSSIYVVSDVVSYHDARMPTRREVSVLARARFSSGVRMSSLVPIARAVNSWCRAWGFVAVVSRRWRQAIDGRRH